MITENRVIDALRAQNTYHLPDKPNHSVLIMDSCKGLQVWRIRSSSYNGTQFWLVSDKTNNNVRLRKKKFLMFSCRKQDLIYAEYEKRVSPKDEKKESLANIAHEWKELNTEQQLSPRFTAITLTYLEYPHLFTNQVSAICNPQTVGGDYFRRYYGKPVTA